MRKISSKKKIDPLSIMKKATALAKKGQLTAMQKVHGNERGRALYNLAKAKSKEAIGRPC